MKTNKKQIAELSKYLESNLVDIKHFKSQINYYEERIKHGESLLLQYAKSTEDIKKNIPNHHEQLRVNRLSLKGHERRLTEQRHRLALLLERENILRQLEKLER